MKFTIGIPAFKASFLKECIDSILSQTFVDFELIIINDASPERLDLIINTYKDERIKYFKNEINTGAENVVNNWNKCLEKAQGEFFLLMGDDDKLSPDYLMEFNNLINKFPMLDVYHCRSLIIDEHSNFVEFTPSWPEYETVFDNIWHRIKGFRKQYISDFVYRTTPLKNNGGFYFLPLAWGSDDITAYRQMTEKGIAHTNLPLLFYRNSPITISNTGNLSLKLSAIAEEKKWFNLFFEKAKPTANDNIIMLDIKRLLPDYFNNKTKYTLSFASKKSFLDASRFFYKEMSDKKITPKEVLSANIKIIKSKIINATKFKF